VVKGKEPKSTVQLIYTGAAKYSRENRLKMDALSSLLSIMLREQLRQQMSGVYGVSARGSLTHYPKEEYRFNVSFGCAPERVEELITAADKVIDSVKQFGANNINLTKIKETLLRQREVDLKDNKFWLRAMSQYDEDNENIEDIMQFNTEVNTLTSDDFKTLANEYLTKTNYAKFVLMPE
jgi:zinc protease